MCVCVSVPAHKSKYGNWDRYLRILRIFKLERCRKMQLCPEKDVDSGSQLMSVCLVGLLKGYAYNVGKWD